MENYRSQSCRDERNTQMDVYYGGSRDERNMQMEVYYGGSKAAAPPPQPTSMRDLKSYSVNYGSSSGSSGGAYPNHQISKDVKMKKGKSSLGVSTSKIWSLADPELQRKKRVAGYKVYTAEEKMKGSIRKSFRWIKNIVNVWR